MNLILILMFIISIVLLGISAIVRTNDYVGIIYKFLIIVLSVLNILVILEVSNIFENISFI